MSQIINKYRNALSTLKHLNSILFAWILQDMMFKYYVWQQKLFLRAWHCLIKTRKQGLPVVAIKIKWGKWLDCNNSVCCFVFFRKKVLLFNNVVAIAAAFLMLFSRTAKSFEMILLGRFLYGYNVGMFKLIDNDISRCDSINGTWWTEHLMHHPNLHSIMDCQKWLQKD